MATGEENSGAGTLYEQIAAQVRELISSKRLGPGDRLPTERELAESLGVSRVPIREAIRTLSAQGIVEVRRSQGTFVAERGLEGTVDQLTSALIKQRHSFADLLAVRRLLEPAAAQWAANRAEAEEVDRLERILAAFERAAGAEPSDYEEMAERDSQLHVELAVVSGNPVLVRIMQAIQDLHRDQLETSLRYKGRVSQTVADHRRIVAAIAAGDPVEAGSAMIDHIARTKTAALGGAEAD